MLIVCCNFEVFENQILCMKDGRWKKITFFIILMKQFLRKKISIRKRNLKFLQILHCGKFFIDFHNINLHNFTLVTAGELDVNGGRIWAHERREFWFTDLWNSPGLHEIRWKEDFRMTRPTFKYIVHLVRPFIAKRDTIQKGSSNWEKGGYCLVEIGNRKQLSFYRKKFCFWCKINGCWNHKRILQMYYRDGFWLHSISKNWEGNSRGHN